MSNDDGRLPSRSGPAPDVAAVDEGLPTNDAVAVLVFGSVARGDDNEASDVDVMVVAVDREAADAVDRAVRADRSRRVIPTVRTVSSLLDEARDRPSFIAHLVDEAVVVRASPSWPAVRDQLARAGADPEALGREVQGRLRHLDSFARPERFRLSPVTALSHLWAIARSVVIARLLQRGVHEYSWRRAFDRYADLRPELRGDLDALKQLRPYYECARARPGARLPEAPVDTDAVRRLVGSIEQIAR